jgi:hypothetical protein
MLPIERFYHPEPLGETLVRLYRAEGSLPAVRERLLADTGVRVSCLTLRNWLARFAHTSPQEMRQRMWAEEAQRAR